MFGFSLSTPSVSSLLALAPHTALLALLWGLLRWLHRWPRGYAIALWPGTVAHELLHYLAGILTGARPVSMRLLPRRQDDGVWELGSVSFARLRWWNSVPVGLAPMALLPAGGWILMESASWPVLSGGGAAMKFVALQCLLAGWPSRRDWSHALVGLLAIAVLALLGIWLIRS